MALCDNSLKAVFWMIGRRVCLLALCLLPATTAASQEAPRTLPTNPPPQSPVRTSTSPTAFFPALLANTPRQAILVCYCPNVERLAVAWNILAPLRDDENSPLRVASEPLGRSDEAFLQTWADRFGLTVAQITAALPGEVMVGWMPRRSGKESPLDPEGWALVARRSRERDEAIRSAWKQMLSNAAGSSRLTRRVVGRVTIEQAAWQESRPSRMKAPRTGKRGAGSRGGTADSVTFNDVARVEQRALSLGWGDEFVFFTPTRAEALEPWILAATEGQGVAGRTDRLSRLIQETGEAAEMVLAVRGVPPAWASAAETTTDRILGADPQRVLLSQLRSLDAVFGMNGNQVLANAQTNVLPPPGWVARLMAPLADGATFSDAPERSSEICVRADFGKLWQAAQGVLMECWPAVAVALHLFLDRSGSPQGEGLSQLAAEMGDEARVFLFRINEKGRQRSAWAVSAKLRDPARFAQIESHIERILSNFARIPVHYSLAADRRLQPRTQGVGPTAAPAAHVHIVQWDGYVAVASSRAALERALQATMQTAAEPSAPGLHPPAFVLNPSPEGRRPSVVFHHEILPASADGLLDGMTRRIIRTENGAVELVSPPPDGKASRAEDRPAPPAIQAGSTDPIARISAALIVASANSVRLRAAVESFQLPTTAKKPAAPPKRRDFTVQE